MIEIFVFVHLNSKSMSQWGPNQIINEWQYYEYKILLSCRLFANTEYEKWKRIESFKLSSLCLPKKKKSLCIFYSREPSAAVVSLCHSGVIVSSHRRWYTNDIRGCATHLVCICCRSISILICQKKKKWNKNVKRTDLLAYPRMLTGDSYPFANRAFPPPLPLPLSLHWFMSKNIYSKNMPCMHKIT